MYSTRVMGKRPVITFSGFLFIRFGVGSGSNSLWEIAGLHLVGTEVIKTISLKKLLKMDRNIRVAPKFNKQTHAKWRLTSYQKKPATTKDRTAPRKAPDTPIDKIEEGPTPLPQGLAPEGPGTPTPGQPRDPRPTHQVASTARSPQARHSLRSSRFSSR